MMNKIFLKHLSKELKSASEYAHFSILVFLILFLTLGAQADDRTVQVNALMTAQNFEKKPGAAILVVENGRIVYQKGFGLADLKSGRAIASDTAFDLASLTKQFTAMAILQLTERCKLELDDSFRKFYP